MVEGRPGSAPQTEKREQFAWLIRSGCQCSLAIRRTRSGGIAAAKKVLRSQLRCPDGG